MTLSGALTLPYPRFLDDVARVSSRRRIEVDALLIDMRVLVDEVSHILDALRRFPE